MAQSEHSQHNVRKPFQHNQPIHQWSWPLAFDSNICFSESVPKNAQISTEQLKSTLVWTPRCKCPWTSMTCLTPVGARKSILTCCSTAVWRWDRKHEDLALLVMIWFGPGSSCETPSVGCLSACTGAWSYFWYLHWFLDAILGIWMSDNLENTFHYRAIAMSLYAMPRKPYFGI